MPRNLPASTDVDLFIRKAREMMQRPLAAQGMLGSDLDVSNRNRSESTVQLTINSVHSDCFRSFCLDFRKFVSPGEPIFVNRVANHLHKELTGDAPRTIIATHRADYNADMKSATFAYAAATGLDTRERLLNAWLNGILFHDDREKSERLQGLEPAGRMFSEIEFLELIRRTVHYVEVLAEVGLTAKRDGLI
ncbi:MAG: hypothetical protein V3V01_09105 [Acidimicrobiales bacterium]